MLRRKRQFQFGNIRLYYTSTLNWLCFFWVLIALEWLWKIGCLTLHATMFQLYMWRHICAGGLKKKLDLRSGSQRHRHFVGFFNVPVQVPTNFFTVIPRNRLILVAFHDAHGDSIRRRLSNYINPREDAGVFKSRICPPYPQRVVKGRWVGITV